MILLLVTLAKIAVTILIFSVVVVLAISWISTSYYRFWTDGLIKEYREILDKILCLSVFIFTCVIFAFAMSFLVKWSMSGYLR